MDSNDRSRPTTSINMADPLTYVKLAKALPDRLKRFFARYPPPALVAGMTEKPVHSQTPNPFQSQKHPDSGNWHDPVFSLRRQADLVKLARAHGVEELLPFTVKGTKYKLEKRLSKGLRVKGTGVGERVKGKEWERTMKTRLEARRQAMINMPQLIKDWKERGHGRGWKKWPK